MTTTYEAKEHLNTGKMSFDDILQETKNIQVQCKDYIVSNAKDNMWIDETGNLHFVPDDENRELDMPMSAWSIYQLSNMTGIPYRYVIRMLNMGKGQLFADNANTWLNETKKRGRGKLVRTYTDYVRGLMTTAYSRCDMNEVCEGLFTGPLREGAWDHRGSYINHERLHLRFTQKDTLKIDGDLFPAVFIDTSDVGRCSLRIEFGIYRLACTNGLTIPAFNMKFQQRHIGINKNDFLKIVAESVSRLPDMITYAEDLIRYTQQQKIQLVTNADIDAVVKQLENTASLNESEAKKVIEITREKYWPTQWGLVNGLTEYAQTRTLESRLDLEASAGKLLIAA